MFGWFKRKPREIHIIVRVEVSGNMSINLENFERLPNTEGYKSSRSSTPSIDKNLEGKDPANQITPTISADFFADTKAPEVDFGEEVDTGD